MTPPADILALQHTLSNMADLAADMGREAHARYKSSEDPEARSRAVADFDVCARNVRLSALCYARLAQALRLGITEEAGLDRSSSSRPAKATDVPRYRDRDWEREKEREREYDRDGHPLTAMGRAEALETAIARNPGLDPDGRYSARIIDIKARLNGETPEPPEPEPPSQTFHTPPTNRAERRRLEKRKRRASG